MSDPKVSRKRGPYKLSKTAAERFWDKVDKSGGPDACWPWTASRFESGSETHLCGQFRYLGKTELSHRVAFHLTHGRWPEPCGLHSCDFGLCCNPAHIGEGTKKQNSEQMVARRRNRVGEKRWNAKTTWQIVLDIRANAALCRVTHQELAERYGLKRAHVASIISGRIWKRERLDDSRIG